MLELNNRKDSIDFLRAACAFLVVCIHIPFPGIFGEYFVALARIAVPAFFMISGYFYEPEKINKQIKKAFVLVVIGNIVYFIWDLICGFISGNMFSISFRECVIFLLFNVSPFGGHLWYLGAYLYVLLIVKYCNKKFLYYSIPLLLLADLILGKYSLLLFHQEIPYVIVRNFIFVGIPYYSIGLLMNEKKFRISKLGIPFFSLTTIVERYFLISVGANAIRDHYISTTFLSIAVFSFALDYKHTVNGMIAKIGREYSTWIYIIHPIIITSIALLIKRLGLYNVYVYIAPIVIYIISAGVSAFIVKIFSKKRAL